METENKTNIKNIEIKSNIKNMELYSDTFPFSLSLKIRNFENEGEYKKFVKNVEMLIRRSYEYKLWRNYIIEVLQINTCMITNESIDQVTIEVHHHIPSLFTIVSSIVNKKIENNIDFHTFDIAIETIELHYKNKIGYVTLLKSMHEKFHNGYLDIPINMVKGDYKYYLNNYSQYLNQDKLDTIQARLAINEHNCSWSKDDYQNLKVGVV
jgi:hypothetical protein